MFSQYLHHAPVLQARLNKVSMSLASLIVEVMCLLSVREKIKVHIGSRYVVRL